MIEKLQPEKENVIAFRLTGKLHDEDYKAFVPEVEALIAREGKIRLLLQLENFQGWDLHAAWDDITFGIKHFRDLERIAVVGDLGWEKWMLKLSKPFSEAKTRFFPADEMIAAWDWLLGEESQSA
ncbi:MAG TPA: STAS/SEC14 domain-containing protein [Gammaproteobacteria bacterium]|nr:STAS/SEC14 domain-containing protein [Gammaproteobacteria bacterium]